MPDITITLNKNESIQFNQLKTQAVSSIFNLEDKPLVVTLKKIGNCYLVECTSGSAYMQGWATKATLWKDSQQIKTIVEVKQ